MTENEKKDPAPVKHATLAQALVAAQREARSDPLRAATPYEAKGKNSGVRVSYNYADAEDTYDWGVGLLNRHGIAFAPGAPAGPPVAFGEQVVVPLGYTLIHESGERQAWTVWAPLVIPWGGDLLKGAKFASTTIGKYAVMDALGVRPKDEDPEPYHGARKQAEDDAPPPPPPPGSAAPAPIPPPPSPVPAPGAPTTTASPAPAVPTAPPAPTAGGAATTARSPATPAAPGIAATMESDLLAVEAGYEAARHEALMAASRAASVVCDRMGVDRACLSQILLEGCLAGEDADLNDLKGAHAVRATKELHNFVMAPYAKAACEGFAARRRAFLASVASESKAPEAAAPVPLPPPAPAQAPTNGAASATAASDPALGARWSRFLSDTAVERRRRFGLGEVSSTPQAIPAIASSWARAPGLFAVERDLESTKAATTAEVMALLEAGLASWKTSPLQVPIAAGGAR